MRSFHAIRNVGRNVATHLLSLLDGTANKCGEGPSVEDLNDRVPGFVLCGVQKCYWGSRNQPTGGRLSAGQGLSLAAALYMLTVEVSGASFCAAAQGLRCGRLN